MKIHVLCRYYTNKESIEVRVMGTKAKNFENKKILNVIHY